MGNKANCVALLAFTCSFSTGAVYAVSTAELEKVIKQQEKRIELLERRQKGTINAVKANRGLINHASDRLRINGFFSGGVAEMDGASGLTYSPGKITEDYSTRSVAKLGLQFTFQVSDTMDLNTQLVSRGVGDYNLETEWAYLSYEYSKKLTFRIGRQRIPYYLLSEYLDVGYAYPWVRTPMEMYSVPVSSSDGVGALYDFRVGEWNLSWQGLIGATNGYNPSFELDFELDKSWSSVFFAERGSWTFRLGYSRSHFKATSFDPSGLADNVIAGNNASIELNNTLAGQNSLLYTEQTIEPLTGSEPHLRSRYQSFSFSYDDGKLLVLGEISNLRLKGLHFPGGDGGYLTIGYRFGKWMPHATAARFYSDSYHDNFINAHAEFYEAVQQKANIALAGLDSGIDTLEGNIGAFPDIQTCTLACTADQRSTLNSLLIQLSGAQEQRDNLFNAIKGLNQLSVNTRLVKQQQSSYTLGITYDINPRVKAKIDVAFYENFGIEEMLVFDESSLSFVTQEILGSSRFATAGGPGSGDKNTTIYSFAIDAVF